MYFQENSEILGSVRYISMYHFIIHSMYHFYVSMYHVSIIFIQMIKSDDKLFKKYIVKQQQQQ